MVRGELRSLLDEIETDGEAMGETRLRAALRRVVEIAIRGADRDALAATRWMAEQIDGRVPLAVEQPEAEAGIVIRFVEAKPPGDESDND